MKDIRIFVASSKELLPERNALAYFVLAHEDEFAKRGLRVRLSKWEYVDPTMTEERTEDRYLDEMLNCDAVLMLFRHVLGKYTKEEVDKAIAAEVAGTSRIKKHLILFKEGDADESPELATWRASLAEGTYGTFTDAGGLGAHFLRLVEQIAGLPLQDVADAESEKTISAFLAVDDELAVDRDAFADAVLNLNDVLSHRGARVRLRFYDPEQHRDILDNSEMALVLYQTKCGAFGTSALKESYDRAKEEKNPKRLYVFFRDAAGKPLDADFQTFKDGFAEAFGSSPCRFENVDTLSLNFLFALESVLGDGAGTFVKLDGRTVVADGLEVGDLTKLPMLEKNTGIADLFSRMEDVSKRFVAQREKCDKNPQDDGLYVELLDLSAEKNRLQDQIDRELKMSFNLAKRLAAISIAQVNETIARARAKVEEGDIKGALEILDGASSALKRRRLLHKAADRAEAEELQIKELKAGAEIEYFRVDAVMAYTAMLFEERFKKAEGLLSTLFEDVESYEGLVSTRNVNDVTMMRSVLLVRKAELFELINAHDKAIPCYEGAVSALSKLRDASGRGLLVDVLVTLGNLYPDYRQKEKAYGKALEWAKIANSPEHRCNVIRCAQKLSSLAEQLNNSTSTDEAEIDGLIAWLKGMSGRDGGLHFLECMLMMSHLAISCSRNEGTRCVAKKILESNIQNWEILIRKFRLGQNGLARDLCCLANLQLSEGDCAMAFEKFSAALGLLERFDFDNPYLYGPELAECAKDIFRISTRNDCSVELRKKCLWRLIESSVRLSALGEFRNVFLVAHLCVAQEAIASGDFDKAVSCSRRALDNIEPYLNDSEFQVVYFQLAAILAKAYLQMKRIDDARFLVARVKKAEGALNQDCSDDVRREQVSFWFDSCGAERKIGENLSAADSAFRALEISRMLGKRTIDDDQVQYTLMVALIDLSGRDYSRYDCCFYEQMVEVTRRLIGRDGKTYIFKHAMALAMLVQSYNAHGMADKAGAIIAETQAAIREAKA